MGLHVNTGDREMIIRFLGFLSVLFVSSSLSAEELRIAAWNLEHLNADEREGCVLRTQNDYDIIKKSIDEYGYDIVAIQEVKDVAAARRVFPANEWEIELSNRPHKKATSECWGLPNHYLQHLATGFAIRKGISYQRNADYKALGLNNDFQRWGTDITLQGKRKVRLLSVHLKTGCWRRAQDVDESKIETCDKLRSQIDELVQWRNERQAEKVAFLILGDFNRNLDIPNDWAWNMLRGKTDPMKLLTGGIEAKCDSRYPNLIDHIAASKSAVRFVVAGSTKEGPRVGEHPDHCAVYTSIRI